MRVLLVHHADAVGPDVDPQRPLSALGRFQAAELAALAADLKFAPAAIWHSGKVRARETAEAFLRVCAPFAQFKAVRGLQPDDPPEWMRDELAAADDDRDVLVAGHMPHIARLTHLLSDGTIAIPLHGMVGFERQVEGGWRVFSGPTGPSRS